MTSTARESDLQHKPSKKEWRVINTGRAAAALLLTATFALASCSGSGSSGSSSGIATNARVTVSSSASQSNPPRPTTFTSKAYGYTLTVPAGWSTRQAFAKWDGESELDGSSAFVDLIGTPSDSKGVWAAAGRTNRDLAADTTFAITWNYHYHGDHCPRRPDMRNRLTIGGRPGVLLAYNCGILINFAVTVDHGVEYWYTFVDRGVAAATDPADHATFLKMLSSVQFAH